MQSLRQTDPPPKIVKGMQNKPYKDLKSGARDEEGLGDRTLAWQA